MKIKSHKQEVLDALDAQVLTALEACGMVAFANMECGLMNGWGEAMQIYLRKRGII